MLIRVCVHLENPDYVGTVVHGTRYEPAYIDRGNGVIAYIIPRSKVRKLLRKIATIKIKSPCRFKVHFARHE